MRRAAVIGLLLVLGCAGGSASSSSLEAPQADAPGPVEARVEAMLAQARAEEPKVTPMLEGLAQSGGGRMVKLEHRLKTRRSATRKLKLRLANDPTLRPELVTLEDMLRYTMQVEDEPRGNYVTTVRRSLAVLEAAGHSVVRVKNYWPMGDNYSGVNAVLRTSSGLPWELQFHTRASLDVQARTRPQYEELRRIATPTPRKQQLFDEMTESWDQVPVPQDVLQPSNLHEAEVIRERPRP